MKSQTIAAVLATVIGLAVAVYAFACVLLEIPTRSDRRVERTEVPKAPVVQAMPIVKGPVVRDLPLPEK